VEIAENPRLAQMGPVDGEEGRGLVRNQRAGWREPEQLSVVSACAHEPHGRVPTVRDKLSHHQHAGLFEHSPEKRKPDAIGMARAGIEPATPRFSVVCSTD
jgi:hypothetical protein